MIRLTSRTLINQIKLIGLKYDIYFSGNKPYIQSQKAKIRQKRPMYSANVNMNCNKEFFLSLNNRKINKKNILILIMIKDLLLIMNQKLVKCK